MSALDNKMLIRSLFAELSAGNPQPLLDNMAEDVCYTISGSTKYSGALNGKHEVIEKLLAPLAQELAGAIAIIPENLIAENEYVVMQSHGKAKAKNGKSYDNTYCHVFRLIHGKIQQITEYLDTELATEVFGRNE